MSNATGFGFTCWNGPPGLVARCTTNVAAYGLRFHRASTRRSPGCVLSPEGGSGRKKCPAQTGMSTASRRSVPSASTPRSS